MEPKPGGQKSSQESPFQGNSNQSLGESVYCHVCGLKNHKSRSFCGDCESNLKPDYDFPFSYYETTGRFNTINDLAQSLPTTRIVEFFLNRLGTPWVEAQLLGSAVKIGEKQFPELYEASTRCAEVLSLPKMPRIYVSNTPNFFGDPWQVFTLGTNDDPITVVSAAMASRVSNEEFRFIIGREMGHVKCGHPLYSTVFEIAKDLAALSLGYGLGVDGLKGSHSLLGKVAGTLLGSIVIDQPLTAVLNAWYREANYTADRAGMLLVGDIGVVKSIFARLLTGWYFSGGLASQLNFDELLNQEEELTESTGRYSEYLGPIGNFIGPISLPKRFNPGYSMPFDIKRFKALIEFQESPEYKQGREIIGKFAKGIYDPVAVEGSKEESRFCGYCGNQLKQENDRCSRCGLRV